MRKSISIWLACVLIAMASQAMAATLDEVVTGNLETKGGEEAWLALQSAKMSGIMLMGGAGGSAEMAILYLKGLFTTL